MFVIFMYPNTNNLLWSTDPDFSSRLHKRVFNYIICYTVEDI